MAVFDDEAKSYDKWYKTKLGNFVDKVEKECAFSLFDIKQGMRVLDIGCGTGNYSIELSDLGCEVTGIDVSDDMLNIAREKSRIKGYDIDFYNMNVYDLEFEDEYFDAVFSMAAFEFVEDIERALEEIFRVIKKDGEILIGTINKDSKWGEFYLSKEVQKNSVFKYAKFKTLEDFKKFNEEKIIETKECLFIPPEINEEQISMEKENELSKSEKGGYICVLWKK